MLAWQAIVWSSADHNLCHECLSWDPIWSDEICCTHIRICTYIYTCSMLVAILWHHRLATRHTLLAYANQAVPPLAASTYDKKRVAGHGTQTTPSLTFACCVPHVAATSCRRLCVCACVCCIFGLCILYLVLCLSLVCCPFSVFFFNRVQAFFWHFHFLCEWLCV